MLSVRCVECTVVHTCGVESHALVPTQKLGWTPAGLSAPRSSGASLWSTTVAGRPWRYRCLWRGRLVSGVPSPSPASPQSQALCTWAMGLMFPGKGGCHGSGTARYMASSSQPRAMELVFGMCAPPGGHCETPLAAAGLVPCPSEGCTWHCVMCPPCPLCHCWPIPIECGLCYPGPLFCSVSATGRGASHVPCPSHSPVFGDIWQD